MAAEQDDQTDGFFSTLKERCDTAGVECELESFEGENYATLSFPAGRKHRRVIIEDHEVEGFLELPFERYRFLTGFDAYCDFEEGTIEANLELASGGSPSVRALAGSGKDDAPDPLVSLRGNNGEEIQIGAPSKSAELILYPVGSLSLRIRGIDISQHDQAKETLEKLANTVLFEMDGRRGRSLILRRRRSISYRRGARKNASLPDTYPISEFDPEPMALYWYGQSASRMPLLQFLAYYQILEFYFDQYSQADARLRVQNILKDPAFSPHRDRDIARVIAATLSGRQRSKLSDERSQLRATIRGCVDLATVEEFCFSRRNKEFFEKKIDGLTNVVVRSLVSGEDLFDAIVNRLYDIRCKIVHTKDSAGGEELGLLLPFSKEAEELGRDTELIEMIARSALIRASRPLQLPAAKSG